MKICPACEAANSQEANFCALCRTPFQRSTRGAYCDKGHAMHPSWHDCLECRGERSQVQDFGSVPPRMPTVMEPGMAAPPRMATIVEVSAEATTAAAPPPYVAPPPFVAPPPPPPARVASSNPNPRVSPPPPEADSPPPQIISRHRTQFASLPPLERREPPVAPPVAVQPVAAQPVAVQHAAVQSAAAQSGAAQAVAAQTIPVSSPQVFGRRIVGLLITYTWNPEGQIFPLREGRNLIGRSSSCDISLPQDSHLSDTNTHVTYRKNFTVGDMVSMGGTDLNGDPIEENFVRLPNYARIRAGSTQFLFISAEAPDPDQAA
jgi:hypothetical protein